jgi:hypothetical protein
VLSAIEDLRPIGIFPEVQKAAEIAIGVKANLVVRNYPLPSGSKKKVNDSFEAHALKARLCERLRGYINNITLEESVVRAAEVTQVLMNDPAVVDVQELVLLRFPPSQNAIHFDTPIDHDKEYESVNDGENVALQGNQIPVSAVSGAGAPAAELEQQHTRVARTERQRLPRQQRSESNRFPSMDRWGTGR